jgi:CHAT domain-containing protein
MGVLREALWDPLEVPEGPVIVIPVDALQTLPMEALPESADANPWTVTRWPHPALLRPRRRTARQAALLLHDRTSGTRGEVQHVARLLQSSGLAVQRGSRRSDVVDGTGRLSLLHVAAHGAFHRRKWLLNGIRLADGWLGFEQLDRARLREALLFFGSCESGLAGEDRGSELDGWMSAGLAAGAAELVLTLWKVDDAAVSAFADAFYPRWCEGMGAPEAAAAARRDMRQLRPHPFAWAPFLTVG